MKPEYANVHNPLAIVITASFKEILIAYIVVGYVQRDISRFCRYLLNKGGLLEGRVRDARYRKFLIPKRFAEIFKIY